jgi:tryptophan 2-monooxygenase
VIRKISPEFEANLEPVNGELRSVDWQREPFYHGAFKLQYPGQDADLSAAYHQFLTANDPHAACAAARRLGATLRSDSPLSQNPGLYEY